jgi:penicillin-binding protein 2A
MYLNRVFLGKGNIYGVGTAAKQYFGKSVSDLTLAESAYLAGLPQAPSSYTQNLELGNKRKNIVLNAMKENGFITESQWMRATAQTISFKNGDLKHSASLDAYVDYVLKEAKDDYGLSEEELKNKGYSIYTYLNTNLQNRMYEATQSFNFKDDKSSNKVQVGIAAVDNNTNKIIALNGGRNFVRGYLNHATAYYQPGSIIKPLAVYTPAFETGKWSPTSQVLDKKTDFDGYSPKNAENIYEGNITLERALIRSANIPAVEVLQDIGVNTGVETLKEMDFDIKQNDEGLHLALGGMDKGVTPIQMAQAYSTFPNLGYFEPAKAIKYIKDKKGNFIEKKDSAYTKGIDIYSPENAYKMTEILEKVISDPSGTGNNANIGRPVAGKTGTAEEAGTTGNRAAWFVGYTPEITMAVHLGFDNPSKSLYLTTPGGDEPARIFAKIMRNTLSGSPVRDFQKPIIQPEHKNALLSKVEDVKANFEAKKNEVASNWEKEKPLIRNFLDNVSNLIQNIVSFIQNLLNNHY